MLMLKQPALAEEVTQEIFLNIRLKAESFNPERGPPLDSGRDTVASADDH